MFFAGSVFVRASLFRRIKPNSFDSFPTYKNNISPLYKYVSKKADTRDTTLNIEEVEKFEKISDKWWDSKGQFYLLHAMNDLRVPLVRDGILNEMHSKVEKQPKPLKNINIVDVGCGAGLFSEPLARLGAFVTGLDPGDQNISIARNHAGKDNEIKDLLNYVCGTVEDLSKLEKKYDAVVCSEVIEHVENIELFVKSCAELTKDKGSLFFTTINKTFMSYLVAIVAAEKMLKIIPQGTHEWKKFVTPLYLESLLKPHGCRVKLVHGMSYNPVTKRWSWSRFSSAFYALHAVKDKL